MRLPLGGTLSQIEREIIERADGQNAKRNGEAYFEAVYVKASDGSFERLENGSGSGDMSKSVYDTDDDGIVDEAATLSGFTDNSANWNTAFGWGNHAGAGYLTSVAWGDVTGKPTTFTPAAHTHVVADITDFPALFDGAYSSLSGLPTLGSAAATASTAYATAAQGTSADTAFGWGNHASSGYLTSITGQSIESLSDVNSMTPNNGDVMTWDNGNNRWDAAAPSGGFTAEYIQAYEAGTTSLSTSDAVVDLDTDRTSSSNMALSSGVVAYSGTDTCLCHVQAYVSADVVGGTRLGLVVEIQYKPSGGSWAIIAEAVGYARTAVDAGHAACSAIVAMGENDELRLVAKTTVSTATTAANRSGMTVARFS